MTTATGTPTGAATPTTQVPATTSTGGTVTGTPTGTPTTTGTATGGGASAGSPTRPPGDLAALRGAVILIDPGHDGGNGAHPAQINKQVFVGNGYKACDTTGTATRSGYAEHEFTWDVATRLAGILRAAGARVVLTRTGDTGVGPCITERTEAGNRAHADLAVSVHADGSERPGDLGFHVIEPASIGSNAAIVGPSRRLGTAIRDAFRAGTGEPYATYTGHDGITVRSDLGGLNLSTVPKVFIECGAMTNAADAARLTSAAWRQRAAEALATGMAAYLSGR